MALLVYVDDIVPANNDRQISKEFKSYLKICFSIKDLRLLKYFLGIEVAPWREGKFLCQHKCALDIVKECGLLALKRIKFPIKENRKLALSLGRVLNGATRYRGLVGRIIYLTITRLKLTYVVHILFNLCNILRRSIWMPHAKSYAF